MLAELIKWIVLGGIVGWVVSLILGRDFRGGCLTYVVVGIVTMVVLGLVIKLLWALVLLSVLFIAVAFAVQLLRGRW